MTLDIGISFANYHFTTDIFIRVWGLWYLRSLSDMCSFLSTRVYDLRCIKFVIIDETDNRYDKVEQYHEVYPTRMISAQ